MTRRRRPFSAVIKDAPAAAHTLLVVGHNPGLHELALLLIASGDVEARERLREKLPTSGLVVIDFAFDEWGKLHPQLRPAGALRQPEVARAAPIDGIRSPLNARRKFVP